MNKMTEEIKKLAKSLKNINACDGPGESIEYVSGCESPKQAWDDCERGDWLLWICGKFAGKPYSDKRKKLVLASCECARLSLKYNDDKRLSDCLDLHVRWAMGENIAIEELKEARNAHYASAAAYAAASRKETLKQCANIVRKHYTWKDAMELLKGIKKI